MMLCTVIEDNGTRLSRSNMNNEMGLSIVKDGDEMRLSPVKRNVEIRLSRV